MVDQATEFTGDDSAAPNVAASAIPAEAPTEPTLRRRAIAGTVWTVIGFAAAYFIRFAGNVVCTHILKFPSFFGVMQTANAVMQGLQMFSDVGIGPNIVQSKHGDDPKFLNTAWTVQVIRAVIIFLVAAALSYPLSLYTGEKSLRYIIPLVAVGALLGGFNSTSIFTLNKRLYVGKQTLLALGSQLAGVTAMVICAIYTRDAWALAVASVVQALVRLVASHLIDRTHRNRFAWEKWAVHSLITFGAWIFVSTVLAFLGDQGDRLILSGQVTMEDLGIYGMALMVARLPRDIIVNLGSAVAFPAYSHAKNTDGDFYEVFKRIRFPLCVSGAFAMATCAVAGPELIKLIWPASFSKGAEYVPLLCIGSLFQVLEVTSGSALLAKGKVKALVVGNALKVAALFAGMFIGLKVNGLWGAMTGVVIAEGVKYLASAFFARREGLPIFGHDVALYILAVAAYFIGLYVQSHIPDLDSQRLTYVLHVVVDGLVIGLIFAWPLWLIARDMLGRRREAAPPQITAEGRSLRITFVLPGISLAGGIRTAALYAEHLTKKGHRVSVIAPEVARVSWKSRLKRGVGGVLAGGSLAPPRGDIGVRATRSHFESSFVDVRLVRGFGRAIAKAAPDADIVIATWWETAEWVNRLPASKGIKTYFVQGYEVWEGQPIHRVEATYRLPFRKITVSDWLANILKSRYSCKDVTVVPNGVDLTRFSSPPRGRQRVPTIGFMFSEQRIKGSDLVLEAVRLARKTVPDLRVVSFGMYGSSGKVPLPEGTDFLIRPRHEQLIDAYSRCDAWIFASRNEGFGLPILEAMACRTPVIAAPAGAAEQIIAHGGGVMVGQEDVEGLAREIVRFVTMSDEQWRQVSDQAVATAARFNREASAVAFEAALLGISAPADDEAAPQPGRVVIA